MGAWTRHFKDGGWKKPDVMAAHATSASVIIADPGDNKHIVIVGVSTMGDCTLYAGTSISDPVVCHYNQGWTDASLTVPASTSVYTDGTSGHTIFYYIDGLVA